MPATVTSYRPSTRGLIAASAVAGLLLAGAAVLWARYGLAVFHEIIVAGMALCF